MKEWHLISGVAFLTTLLAVPLARAWALRIGAIDIPNSRSSHSIPKPRIGGAGIILGVSAGIGVFTSLAAHSLTASDWRLASTLFALGAVGLVDDLRSLPIWVRMPLYLIGAFIITVETFTTAPAGTYAESEYPARAMHLLFFTLLVAWYTNLFNFMDGIDGIAGCAAVVTSASLAVVFGTSQDPGILFALSLSVAAAAAGFLPFNFPPATVFMGDSGSVFLGAACGSLTAAAVARHVVSLPAGLLLMFPFVFDATFTLLRRALSGEKVWHAHRSHLYQQLCDLGLSHRSVTTCYTAASVATASLGLVFDTLVTGARIASATVVLGACCTVAALIIQKKKR